METGLNFDLERVSPTEMLNAIQLHVSEVLNQSIDGSILPMVSVGVQGARGQDFIGAGIRNISEVKVHGEIGDFGFCSFGDGECRVEGNVGHFFGHSVASGIILVRGHVMTSVAALGTGGLIAIYGNAGDRAAVGMQGADVVIRGSVANYAGLGMQSGTLIVGGSAGLHLGHGMRGGTIYIRGEPESISPDIEEQRIREPDRLKIGMLMLKSRIKSVGKEFRMFHSIHQEE